MSKTTIPETTFITIAQQDLYKEPDESSELIDTIPNSKIVVASAKTSNEWYQVNYAGKTGFVPIDSLKQVKTGDPLIIVIATNSLIYVHRHLLQPNKSMIILKRITGIKRIIRKLDKKVFYLEQDNHLLMPGRLMASMLFT